MEKKNFYVVVYDISDDKRRTKLHKRLSDYGSPVQYSVFECHLTNEEYLEMKRLIRKVIKSRIDHVRFYPVCQACKEKIEVTGRNEVTDVPDSIVV